MASSLIRVAAPLLVGVAAGIGAIVGATLTRERKHLELEAAP